LLCLLHLMHQLSILQKVMLNHGIGGHKNENIERRGKRVSDGKNVNKVKNNK